MSKSGRTYSFSFPMPPETGAQAEFLITTAISLGFGILFAIGITLIPVSILDVILEDLIELVQRKVPAKSVLENFRFCHSLRLMKNLTARIQMGLVMWAAGLRFRHPRLMLF